MKISKGGLLDLKPLYNHIIAGKYKGAKIKLPSLQTTRSSKSILKESFFNVVSYDIIDKIFIECFAGSGSIGLEAISRGAKRCYFIEKDKQSFDTLKQNCQNIDDVKSLLVYGDSFDKTPQILDRYNNQDESLILYIDPPFPIFEDTHDIYEKLFDMLKQIKNQNISLIVFECQSSYPMPKNIGRWTTNKTKKFGRSSLVYYV